MLCLYNLYQTLQLYCKYILIFFPVSITCSLKYKIISTSFIVVRTRLHFECRIGCFSTMWRVYEFLLDFLQYLFSKCKVILTQLFPAEARSRVKRQPHEGLKHSITEITVTVECKRIKMHKHEVKHTHTRYHNRLIHPLTGTTSSGGGGSGGTAPKCFSSFLLWVKFMMRTDLWSSVKAPAHYLRSLCSDGHRRTQ